MAMNYPEYGIFWPRMPSTPASGNPLIKSKFSNLQTPKALVAT